MLQLALQLSTVRWAAPSLLLFLSIPNPEAHLPWGVLVQEVRRVRDRHRAGKPGV